MAIWIEDGGGVMIRCKDIRQSTKKLLLFGIAPNYFIWFIVEYKDASFTLG